MAGPKLSAAEIRLLYEQHGAAREGNREEELALQSALGELPEDQRATVIMRIWGGMTLEEIADATAVPLSTAASPYRYALEKLRERLKPWRRPCAEE